MFTHIVFFRLKDKSEENIQKAKEVILTVKGKIPCLRDIEVGTDVIHSERSYDIALVTRFASREDMEAYQVHPVHQEVLSYLAEVRESAAAVDYES